MVKIESELNGVVVEESVIEVDLIKEEINIDDIMRVEINIRRMEMEEERRMVKNDERIGKRIKMEGRERGKKKGKNRRGMKNEKSGKRREDKMNSIIDRNEGSKEEEGRVDINVDIFIRILRLKKEKMREEKNGNEVLEG